MRNYRSLLRRVMILLLLLATPALSTLAKTNWYLPQGNTGHYLTGAVKMRVAHSPLVVEGLPVQAGPRIVPVMPQVRTSRAAEPEPEIPSIGVVVSLQHRSPPSRLS